MKMKFAFVFAIAALLTLGACEKEPGEGGNSSISGTLLHLQYNDDYSNRITKEPTPAQDIDVYIQYGDDAMIQDKIETSPDGYFEFNNLYEGDYKIIYYSEDTLEANRDKVAVVKSFSIAKDANKDLGNLYYIESLDYDDGYASISGQVKEVSFTYNSVWPNMIPTDTLLVLDRAVYIRPLQHKAYAERVRTQGDGSFCFDKLIPGEYEVYVFSEDIKGSDQDVSIKDTVTIDQNDAINYEIEDLIIYNM